MPFWLDDLEDMFDDFGVDATLENGGTLRGIFDNEHIPVGDVPVDSSAPMFTCRSADFTEAELAVADTLTIDDVDYAIRSIQPDGTGVTVLRLEEV